MIGWIASDDVDAVLVASPGPTHEEYVLASIAAGKPVFCEAIGDDSSGVRADLAAEMSCGRRLIHAAHRNPTVPENYTSDMAIIDTAVRSVGAGEAAGPSAWDGFAVSVVSDAAVAAATSGERVAVSVPERPAFYATGLASTT